MISDSLFQTVFYKCVIALALILYGITAWNSHGYYQADEHYQIIEFAGKKLGTHGDHELAWEWQTQSRQTIQPFMVYFIFSALQYVGVNDVYLLAFVLRLLSLLLSLFVIHFFLKNTLDLILEKYHKLYILLSYFLWFMPVIYVRFSSETWSAAMLLLTFSLILSNRVRHKYTPVIIGFLLGFAFLFRYQSAFLTIGLLAWLIFVHKESFKDIVKIISAGLTAVLIGVFIDSWFYGEWFFIPWRYLFYQAIEGTSSTFGISAWHFYLEKMLLAPGWPLGLLFLVSFVHLMVRRPKNIFVWSLIPFIIAHTFVPHKEIRFFFVFINLLPIIFLTSIQLIPPFSLPVSLKIFRQIFVVLIIALNLTGLISMAVKSAGHGRQEITKYISENYSGKQVNLIYTSWASPYNPWHGMPAKFYVEKNVVENRIFSLCDLNELSIDRNKTTLLVLRKAEFTNPECLKELSEFQHIKLLQSVPQWIEFLNSFYRQLDAQEVLVLYEIGPRLDVN